MGKMYITNYDIFDNIDDITSTNWQISTDVNFSTNILNVENDKINKKEIWDSFKYEDGRFIDNDEIYCRAMINGVNNSSEWLLLKKDYSRYVYYYTPINGIEDNEKDKYISKLKYYSRDNKVLVEQSYIKDIDVINVNKLNLLWTEHFDSNDDLTKLNPYIKINTNIGMFENIIYRKDMIKIEDSKLKLLADIYNANDIYQLLTTKLDLNIKMNDYLEFLFYFNQNSETIITIGDVTLNVANNTITINKTITFDLYDTNYAFISFLKQNNKIYVYINHMFTMITVELDNDELNLSIEYNKETLTESILKDNFTSIDFIKNYQLS